MNNHFGSIQLKFNKNDFYQGWNAFKNDRESF